MEYPESLEFCHFDGINGAFVAFVAQFATAAVFGLLEVFGGEKSVDDGNLAGRIQAGNACGYSLTDVVEMGSLATDDTAKNDDGIIHASKCHLVGTTVHVAIDGGYAGHIVVADRIKEDAADAIAGLHAMGVRNTVMLTGDRKEVGEDVARRVGIDDCHTQLLPADKLGILEQLLDKKKNNTTLAFVGDGINDAPALARADVGVAMGALGSDAAIEAADVVLMDDKPSKIVTAIHIARRTLGIARQNVWFAICVKVLVLLLAAVGLATMWMAVFADVGVMVLAVLNAMRTLRLSSD